MLKKNIVANMAGSATIAVLTVAVTPLQISLLGIEAYGLIGLMALLQVLAGSCDFGLSATVIQSIAMEDRKGRSSQRLVESIGAFFGAFSVALAILFWGASEWICERLVNASDISPDVLKEAIGLMGLSVALRYPVIYFSALLSGLQRMETLNFIKVTGAVFRQMLGIALLFATADLISFMYGMVLAGIVEAVVFASVGMRAMPGLRWYGVPSLHLLHKVWRFAAGVQLIALSAAVLTQLDRLIISRMLDLSALAYYTVGYSVMAGISLIHSAINNAALPRLASYAEDEERWRTEYGRLISIVAWASALPCAIVIFYGREIFSLWVGSAVAEAAWMPAAILAAGLLLNALSSMSTTVCTAFRRPSLIVLINAIGIGIYAPLLIIGIDSAGLIGAASAWLILNCYYFLVGIPLIHRAMDIRRSFGWVCKKLVPGPLLALSLLGFAKALSANAADNWISWLTLGVASGIFVGTAVLFGRRLFGGIQ